MIGSEALISQNNVDAESAPRCQCIDRCIWTRLWCTFINCLIHLKPQDSFGEFDKSSESAGNYQNTPSDLPATVWVDIL